jgi:hypothetical protein
MSSNSNGTYSVYIPTIKSSYKSQDIGLLFWNNKIGDVTRVDFAQFKDVEKNEFRQAFVHFIPLERTNSVLEKIEQDGKYKFYPYNTDCINFVEIPVKEYSPNEYWLFLKNNTPVQETEQNIHQIAHNAKLMEEKTAQMEEKTAQMEEKTAQMEEKTAQMEEKMAQMMKKMDIVMELNVTLIGIVELQNTKIENMLLTQPNYVKYPIYVKEEPDYVKEEPKLSEEIYVKEEPIYVKEEPIYVKEEPNLTQIVDLNNEINSEHYKHYENSPLGLINPRQSPNENTIHHLHSDGVITYQKGGNAYGQRCEFIDKQRLNGHEKLNLKFVKEAEYTSYVILTNQQCCYYRGIMEELINNID